MVVEKLQDERRALKDELVEIQRPAAQAVDPEIQRLKAALAEGQQELAQVCVDVNAIVLFRQFEYRWVNMCRVYCHEFRLRVHENRRTFESCDGDVNVPRHCVVT